MKWNSELLGELVRRSDGLQTGPFGSQLHESDYVEDGVGVVMPKDIVAGRIDASSVARVSDETADRLARHRLREGSVLMPRRGDITKHALVSDSHIGWLCGTGCLQVWIGDSYVLPEYLGYYLDLQEVGRWLEQNAVGTTMLNLSAKIVSKLPIRYPHRDEQRAIVHVLKSYDDLIAYNQRRITLLEEAARHLYREWFVRLRFRGAEHTRMVDGLPEGWEERPLGKCARFLSGGTPNKSRVEYWEGDIPWASSGELTQLRLHDTELHVSAEGVDAGSRLVPANTILAVVRGMSLAREFRIVMTAREMAFNQDLKALVCSDDVDPFYLFFSLVDRRGYIRDLATEAAHGTKKLEMSTLERVSIKLPPPRLQTLFREVVDPLMGQWDNLTRQNTKLRTARDLLLPRLMSGQLTV